MNGTKKEDDILEILRGVRSQLVFLCENADTELHSDYLEDIYLLMYRNLDEVISQLSYGGDDDEKKS